MTSLGNLVGALLAVGLVAGCSAGQATTAATAVSSSPPPVARTTTPAVRTGASSALPRRATPTAPPTSAPRPRPSASVTRVPVRAATTATPTAVPTAVPTVRARPQSPCRRPSAALLAWAAETIASHPGPRMAAAVVPVGETSLGRWYVLAVQRAYVLNDGTHDGYDQTLGLANALEPGPGARMIRFGHADTMLGDVPARASWDKVSWSGAKRTRAETAASAAVRCLALREFAIR